MITLPPHYFHAKTCRSIWVAGKSYVTLDLEINPGEVLGIIGPNGAGKTSLLEILSGRYTPKTGNVFYKEKNITSMNFHQRARIGIGRTFQTPVVPEDLTVGETFKAVRQAYKPYLTRFDAEYAADLVDFVVMMTC